MTEAFQTLFSPIKLGPLTLRNRIAMAPLTRQMAEADGTPTDEMAAYYARRARGGLGLIITEGTYEQDAFQSRAYLSQPGITTANTSGRWTKVCDAVHAHDCKIIMQLMHGGRVSDPRVLNGKPPVSASATQSGGWTLYTDTDYEKKIRNIEGAWEKVTFGPARALTVAEIHQVADGFAAGPSARWMPVPTASRCMAPMAICCGSSSTPRPTCAPMNSAAPRKTTSALPGWWVTRYAPPSGRTS